MENIKDKLERTLKNWDKITIQVKQGGKWQTLPLSKITDQREIAKFIMLMMSPYI